MIIALPTLQGGVIVAHVSLQFLWETIDGLQFGKDGQVFVINQNGQVIAHPKHELVLTNTNISQIPHYESLFTSLQQIWTEESLDLEKKPVVRVSRPVGDTGWVVITELPRQEAYATSRMAVLLLYVGLFLVIYVAMRFVRNKMGKMVLQPFEHLRAGAEIIGQGNLAYRVPVNQDDELGQVIAAFNQMADTSLSRGGLVA